MSSEPMIERKYFEGQKLIAEGAHARADGAEKSLFELREALRAFVKAFADQPTYSDSGWLLLKQGQRALASTYKWLFYDFNSPGENGVYKARHGREWSEKTGMPYYPDLAVGDEIAVGDGDERWLGQVERIDGECVFVRAPTFQPLPSLHREASASNRKAGPDA